MSQQKTECQTKFLSADVTLNTTLGDLTYTLDVGSKYSIALQTGILLDGSGDTRFVLEPTHNGANLARAQYRANVGASSQLMTFSTNVSCFQAVDTSLTFVSSFKLGTASILGTGDEDQTFATVCKLPDTVTCE